MSIDVMKQVLAVMDTVAPSVEASAPRYYAAREALRAAIEQAQPELVCVCGAIWEGQELVSSPPQRKPLTEKRIEELYSFWVVDCQDIVGFARAIERTVKGEV
jgi:hypothetical protein